jgi:uncharacterized protein (TIGR00251 family)
VNWARWEGPDLVLQVRVQPRAARDAFAPEADRLRVRITAPPVEGAANEHLVRFLADEFGVSASRVTLVRGATGREKLLRIAAPVRIPAALGAAIAALPSTPATPTQGGRR